MGDFRGTRARKTRPARRARFSALSSTTSLFMLTCVLCLAAPDEAVAGCVHAGAGSVYDYEITSGTSQVVLDIDCSGPYPAEADVVVPDGTVVDAGTDDFGV